MQISPRFCPEDTDPFDTVEWEVRSAAIKDENGNALFEQNDCEIPAQWSQLATNVVVSKYFYGEPGTKQREKSVRQLIHRVTRTITDWGIEDGYFDTQADAERFYRELSWLCLHQHGSFNSPVWFNVGLFHQYGVTGAKCTWVYNRETSQVEQPIILTSIRKVRHAYSKRRRQHGRHHALGQQRSDAVSSSVAVPAPTCRPSDRRVRSSPVRAHHRGLFPS